MLRLSAMLEDQTVCFQAPATWTLPLAEAGRSPFFDEQERCCAVLARESGGGIVLAGTYRLPPRLGDIRSRAFSDFGRTTSGLVGNFNVLTGALRVEQSAGPRPGSSVPLDPMASRTSAECSVARK